MPVSLETESRSLKRESCMYFEMEFDTEIFLNTKKLAGTVPSIAFLCCTVYRA